MTKINLTDIVSELLNMDRFEYLDMITKSESGRTSREIAEEILKSRGTTVAGKIKGENIKVNKRLRRLHELDILVVEQGVYKMSSLGRLLMITRDELKKNAETMMKFRGFFEEHYIDDLPPEFFRQVYKLRGAEMSHDAVDWMREVREHMEMTKRKFYNMTERLHHFPPKFIQKKENGDIEEIVIIYEFFEYPKLNYPEEEGELFEKLAKAGVEFRYINLRDKHLKSIKHPIGIRIVDESWATFGLTRIVGKLLEREQAFVGEDEEFITWCRDLIYHMWHFVAKPLKVDKEKPLEGEKVRVIEN